MTLPGNAAAASLRIFIDSANPDSPLFGGMDLDPFVLAASNNNAPLLNLLAQGGNGRIVAVPQLGNLRGLVFNSKLSPSRSPMTSRSPAPSPSMPTPPAWTAWARMN